MTEIDLQKLRKAMRIYYIAGGSLLSIGVIYMVFEIYTLLHVTLMQTDVPVIIGMGFFTMACGPIFYYTAKKVKPQIFLIAIVGLIIEFVVYRDLVNSEGLWIMIDLILGYFYFVCGSYLLSLAQRIRLHLRSMM